MFLLKQDISGIASVVKGRCSHHSLLKVIRNAHGWRQSSIELASPTSNLPRNILILRHGNSLGNEDETLFGRVPDWKIPLSKKGKEQARAAGVRIQRIVEDNPVYFYVSPYARTKQTLDEVRSVLTSEILMIREEPRLREQDFGNFQNYEQMQKAKQERHKFGRFFYRFPHGESGADVFDRVSAFCGTFHRDVQQLSNPDATVILVTHGITARLFVMRWLHWSVQDFERSENPPNCGLLHLKRVDESGAAYRLEDSSRELINAPPETGIGRALQLGQELESGTGHYRGKNLYASLSETAWGL